MVASLSLNDQLAKRVHGCRVKNGNGHCATNKGPSIGRFVHGLLDRFGQPEGAKDKPSPQAELARTRPSTNFSFKLQKPSQEELKAPVNISVCSSRHPEDRNLVNATHAIAQLLEACKAHGKTITLEQIVQHMEAGFAKLDKPLVAAEHIPALAKAIIGQDNSSYLVHFAYENAVKEELNKYALKGANGETVFETGVKIFGPWLIKLNKDLPAEAKVGDLIPRVLAHKWFQDRNDINHNSDATLVESAFGKTAKSPIVRDHLGSYSLN